MTIATGERDLEILKLDNSCISNPEIRSLRLDSEQKVHSDRGYRV
jgi:hypothetical protein